MTLQRVDQLEAPPQLTTVGWENKAICLIIEVLTW